MTASPAPGTTPEITPDSEHRGLVALLPRSLRGFALLARFDRPIGWWLLFWPGAWAVALAGGVVARWDLILWLLVGAIAMRGAGCVYNDIVDRDLDASVERTRNRPLASGAVSKRAAWVWLLLLCLVGLVVLVQLHLPAAIVSLAAILPVAARAGLPAGRVIVAARKGARSPLRLLSPFILHEKPAHDRDAEDLTPAAQAVLRHGAALDIIHP